MKQKGKILIALLAVVLLLSIAAVALVACNGDGNSPSAPTDPQAPDGHTHIAENFTQVDAPTCTEPGTEGATCTECGEYFTRAIAPLGHDFDWTLTEVNGDLGDEVLTGTIHLTCKRNPNEIYDIEGTAVRTQYSAPTCDAEGFATYNAKGSLDGYEYDVTDTFKLAPHHDWVMGYEMVDGKPEVTLTCSIDGSHIYKTQGEIVSESIVQEGTCSVSGRKSIVISATDEDGHVYQEEDEIDYFAPHSLQGACHWEGEDLWELNVCSNCDYESDKPLPKTLKEEQIYPCTDERESFRTYDYYSEDWETTFEETFYYKDHKFTEWGFAQEPTCKDGGIKAPKCSVCGALSDENREPVQPSPEYHRFETVYDIDAHWEECSVCQEERGSHIAHAYDTVGECDCGRELFEFELNQNDTYTLKKFNCGVNEVVVPAQYKGVDVTEIGAYAFGVKNNEASDIDDYDRSNRLGSVESISLPESITTINEHAFSGCGMTTFNIPASVVKIEGYMHDGEHGVFENCSNLKSISVDPKNAAYCSYDGILYSKADKIEICHVPQAIEGDVDILNGCWTISDDAFINRTGMTSVNIPSSVQSIGWFSFDGCTGLKTVNIEEGLDSIGGGAFVRCDSLTSFIIPNSVTIFHRESFGLCKNLETLTIGEGVTRIEYGEMNGCDSLTTVNWNATNCVYTGSIFAQCPKFDTINVGEKVQTIPNYIFKDCTHLQTVNWNATNCTDVGSEWISGCTQLATVNIGENVQTIPNSVFSGCIGLQTVTIPKNVKSIGSSVFSGCTGLQSVSIESDISIINSDLFYGCMGLKEITIPDSVTSIGESAFAGCTSLKEVTIPENVTSIGNLVFEDCSSLTTVNWNATNCTKVAGYYSDPIFSGCTQLATVNIGENVQSIPNRAFCDCTELKEITIPGRVTSVGEYAFEDCTSLATVNWNASNCTDVGSEWILGCTQLATVNIGENVQTIPNSVFSGCTGLQTVTISNGVQSIGASAFSHCTGLQTVTISDSVTSIQDYAFDDCTNITTATYPASAIGYIPQDNLTTVTITIGEIYIQAFSNCTRLREVTIGDGVQKSIGYMAFNNCINITKVNVTSLKSWCEIEFDDDDANPLYEAINAELYANGQKVDLVDLVIPAGTSRIGANAFFGLTDITSVTIPDSVISIGDDAFYMCTGLQTVTIGNGVTSIGESAFSGCIGFREITIPANVQSIGDHAFYMCTGLQTVTISNGVTNIGEYAFGGCAELQTVMIGNGVQSIGSSAFDNCTGITKVNYLGTLKSWCEIEFSSNPLYAANNNKAGSAKLYVKDVLVTEVKDLDGINEIPAYAFYGLTDITSVTIPESVISIGSSAFYKCESLKEIIIPDSVQSIGTWSFSGCTNITTATYPASAIDAIPQDSLTTVTITSGDMIYPYAFNNRTSLREITIPESVTIIGDEAFHRCTGLTEITIPDSVTSIGESAFRGCTGFREITIPANVQSIGDHAFYECYHLVHIRNLSDVQLQSPASIGGEVLTSADVQFQNTLDKDINDILTYTVGDKVYAFGYDGTATHLDLSLNITITDIYPYAFFNHTNITSVTIPDSVTSIGYYAFYGCTGLSEITIPDSVTSIGNYAFFDCTGLQTVNWNATNCTKAGYLIFGDCIEFTTVNIGENVRALPSYAFYGCTGLSEITIPESVTSIGSSAFSGCTGLQTVNWKATNCTETGSYSNPIFEGCTKLTTVNIGEDVRALPSYAFYGCTGLSEITIPDSVTSIGNYAFFDCTGLQTVTINAQSIGYDAFEGCTGLQTIVIGAGVTSIGNYAFYGCEGLQTVYYEGTSEQWNDISIGEYQNSSFINAKRYYFSGQDPYQNGTAVEDEEYWHWNEEHIAPEVWAKQD